MLTKKSTRRRTAFSNQPHLQLLESITRYLQSLVDLIKFKKKNGLLILIKKVLLSCLAALGCVLNLRAVASSGQQWPATESLVMRVHAVSVGAELNFASMKIEFVTPCTTQFYWYFAGWAIRYYLWSFPRQNDQRYSAHCARCGDTRWYR